MANLFSSDVTILLGDGTGDFTEAPGSPLPVGNIPTSVAVGDFDGDGDLDLAVANLGSNDVTILINQSPDAERPPAREKPASPAVAALAAETRGARPATTFGPALLRREESVPRVAVTADRAGMGDAGGEAIPLARTGLPLPPLALVGSLLLGAGARLRRAVGVGSGPRQR